MKLKIAEAGGITVAALRTLGLVALAAIVLAAPAAQAQTPTAEGTTVDDATGNGDEVGTFIASATLASSFEFTVDDNTLECADSGTPLVQGSSSCPINEPVQITVRANEDWDLVITDYLELDNDVVLLSNVTDPVLYSTSYIQLNLQVDVPLANRVATPDTGTVVQIDAASIPTNPADPGSVNLADDGPGDYEGFFTVTLTPRP